MLVVDPGFHTAPVRRVALSADERLVATASDDKTVALWRTDTAERLHVLRGRPGPGAQGRMYGVAFHPQRDLVAIGGTGAEATEAGGGAGASLHLHAAGSGEFVRSIDAGRGEIKRLAWSADGRWLIATFAGPGAVRVFSADGRRAADVALRGDGYGLAVNRRGLVAVTDTAGALQLFDLGPDGRLAARAQADLGGTPVAAAFAPAGDRLAVVHFDAARQGTVTIVDARGAAVLGTWRAPRLTRGRLQAVAWSHDGLRLAVGGVNGAEGVSGRAAIDAVRGVVQEFDAGTGIATTLHEVAVDAVTDLQALANGDFAFSTFDGRWGRTGQATPPPQPRHEAVRRPDRLWLAAGPVLQWQGAGAAMPRHFSLVERVARAGAVANARPPLEPGAFSGTREWDSVANAVPTLLGGTMALDVGEISRAVARIPGTDDVAWGTGHRVARVGPGGRIVWSHKPGTETRAVHATEDGQLVVAALSDGTLRWLRARDGALLLSLFVLDHRQWVLWSPAGYYDASAGAEPMLGWLLPAEAVGGAPAGEGDRFVSISRFRERFHRPDVIDRLLVDLDERVALQHADLGRAEAMRADGDLRESVAQVVAAASAPVLAAPADLHAVLPPVLVYKQAPFVTTQGAQVTLDFGIRLGANEALASVVVRLDGVLQEDAEVRLPPALEGAAPVRVKVQVPPGDSVVHVSAANAHGFSDALAFKVRREGPPVALPPPDAPGVASAPAVVSTPVPAPGTTPTPAPGPAPAPPAGEAGADKPRLFALLVGVGRYADPAINGLDLPAKDADDLARVLESQGGRAYRSVQTRVLTDRQATRAAIVAGLEWLSRSVGPRDFGVLFIAGHALNHANGAYYFLGHDTVADRLAATAVAQSQIRSTLARLKGRAVLFVDTCHAGNVFGAGGRTASRDLARLANELASPENGVIVFASSTGRQLSLESREWGNGAFTRAIVAGLNGGADLMGRGRVTFQGLGYYVSAEVEKLTGGRQTPVVIAPPPGLPDFTLALLRTERIGALPTSPWPAAHHRPAPAPGPVPLASLAAAALPLRGGRL
jgi:WD40 repeat protein